MDPRIQSTPPTTYKVTLVQDCDGYRDRTGYTLVSVPDVVGPGAAPTTVNVTLVRSALVDTSNCSRSRLFVSALDGNTGAFGGVGVTVPPVLCFARAVLTAVLNPIALNTAGGQTVQLLGSNFCDLSAVVRATYAPQDGTTAPYVFASPGCRVQAGLQGLVLECATAPGVGAHHRWTASVNGLVGEVSAPLTSYASPVVQQVRCSGTRGCARAVACPWCGVCRPDGFMGLPFLLV